MGLMNLSDDISTGVYKLKINMSDVQSYSVFEGEIIVAEGFPDNTFSRFNVNRIFKP